MVRKKILIFLIFLLFLNSISAIKIANKTITGKTTQEDFSLNINVSLTPFFFDILSPRNGTYISKNIKINFIENGSDELFYNINGEENISMNKNTNLNLKNDNYIINFYAKKGNIIIHKVINITIDTDKFKIFYDSYKKNKDTTKFEDIPFEEYDLLNNITLETEFGKIKFKEPIKIPKDLTEDDNILDLDSNSYIEKNKVYINETQLPNFNKRALIDFYNISFIEPIILKDNKICESIQCKIIGHKNKTLTIEVLSFSKYEVIEGYVPPKESPSGGGGRSSQKEISSIELSQDEIFIDLKHGHVIEKVITITNTGTKTENIKIEQKKLEQIISISEKEFILAPKESKLITITFKALENFKPDMYLEELKISTETITKEIWIVFQIESEQALFDTYLTILNDKHKIYPGTKLLLKTDIFNLGEEEEIDAIIKYEIKNSKDKTFISREKTIAVRTKIEFIEPLVLSLNTKKGKYLASIKVDYNNQTAISSESFEVKSNQKYIVLILTILIILIIIFILIKHKKHHKKRNKIKTR